MTNAIEKWGAEDNSFVISCQIRIRRSHVTHMKESCRTQVMTNANEKGATEDMSFVIPAKYGSSATAPRVCMCVCDCVCVCVCVRVWLVCFWVSGLHVRSLCLFVCVFMCVRSSSLLLLWYACT